MDYSSVESHPAVAVPSTHRWLYDNGTTWPFILDTNDSRINGQNSLFSLAQIQGTGRHPADVPRVHPPLLTSQCNQHIEPQQGHKYISNMQTSFSNPLAEAYQGSLRYNSLLLLSNWFAKGLIFQQELAGWCLGGGRGTEEDQNN